MEIKKGQRWTGKNKGYLKSHGWPINFKVVDFLDMGMVKVIGTPSPRGLGEKHDHYDLTEYFIENNYVLVIPKATTLLARILNYFRAIKSCKRG